MTDRLRNIAELADQKQRVTAYGELIDLFVAASGINDLKATVDHLLRDDCPLVVSREVMVKLANSCSRMSAPLAKTLSQ